MTDRPELTAGMDSRAFSEYYYLKEELADFCRKNGLPASGSKAELTERITRFLETGSVIPPSSRRPAGKKENGPEITESSLIEAGFVCSERHRAFFREKIGKSFSFNVPFQNWLKSSPGKTYGEAIAAYREIREERKHKREPIGSQFEYNTYVRDFFADNPGKTLADAIKCWKYKKSLKGTHQYERSDLSVLDR